MANHKNAAKAARSSAAKRLRNRYQRKTARTLIKKIRMAHTKEEVGDLFVKVTSLLDKMAKKNVIHKNKAANLKSALAKKVNSLS